jgi:hypothetical protein
LTKIFNIPRTVGDSIFFPIFASDQIPKRGTIDLSLSKHTSIDVLIGISRAKKQPRESLQQ